MKLETVLCIEDAVIGRRIQPVGFLPIGDFDVLELLKPQNLWFAPRSAIEDRPDFRQIIPYIILRYEASVVVYQRTSSGGESRLHGVLSLGLGGHVGLDDVVMDGRIINVTETLLHTAYREVREEVDVTVIGNRTSFGTIYDNTDAVSTVHLGLVEIWDVNSPHVLSAEASISECQLIAIDQLESLYARMEGWSRLCVPFLLSTGTTQGPTHDNTASV